MLAEKLPRLGLVDPNSPSSEPFRTLRLAIDLRSHARTGNAIVVTSPDPGDGKSTVAANYAFVSSFGQSRVLLIDGDLRNPTLHKIFGFSRSPGLIDLLRDDLSLSSVKHEVSAAGRLDFLAAGSPMSRPGDVGTSLQMAKLIEQASKEYDTIVIDSPPALRLADAAGLASHPGTDALLVVRRSTKKRHLVKALRELELMEANVLGIVVNRTGRLTQYTY